MMSYDDLTPDEQAYVVRERRQQIAWLLFMLAALVLVVFVAAGGDMDDSRNGCATPSCEVGRP